SQKNGLRINGLREEVSGLLINHRPHSGLAIPECGHSRLIWWKMTTKSTKQNTKSTNTLCGSDHSFHKEHEESQRKKFFASLRELCGQFSFFQGVETRHEGSCQIEMMEVSDRNRGMVAENFRRLAPPRIVS